MRVAEYTFRAQLADRWRDRRVFLLGDAAHLTPPFIGQGMGAGLRDAANLAWKLAGVLDGDPARDAVLDTYQAERKPHARALIRLAKLVGTAMTEGGELGNLLRRLVAPRLHLAARRLTDHVLNSETPPLRRPRAGACGPGCAARWPAGSARTPCSEDGRRFDDVAAGRFAARHHDRSRHRPSAPRSSGAAASSSRPAPAPNCTAGCAADTPAPPSSAPTAPCYEQAATSRRCAPPCPSSPQTTGTASPT